MKKVLSVLVVSMMMLYACEKDFGPLSISLKTKNIEVKSEGDTYGISLNVENAPAKTLSVASTVDVEWLSCSDEAQFGWGSGSVSECTSCSLRKRVVNQNLTFTRSKKS